MKHRKILLSVITSAMILSSCGPNSSEDLGTSSFYNVSNNYDPEQVNKHIELAENSINVEEANDNYINALSYLTNKANSKEAETLKIKINKTKLNEEQELKMKLLSAKLDIVQGNTKNASTELKDLKIEAVPAWFTEMKGNLLAQAYSDRGEIVSAIESLTDLENSTEKNNFILSLLNAQSLANLNKANKPDTSEYSKAWLELNLLTRNPKIAFKNFNNEIHNWQEKHPNHPANETFTTALIEKDKKLKVALLLPFNGPLAKTSQNILQGFLASYYDNNDGEKNNLSLIVKDTYKSSFQEAFEDISTKEKFDIIIGGLGKDELKSTDTISNDTTLVLLNNSSKNTYQENIFKYSLSQTEETSNLARELGKGGFYNALVISTKGKWQQNIANTFLEQWQATGAKASLTLLEKNYSRELKQSFNIDQSESRAMGIEKIINKKFKFVPTRRNDIDIIFLATGASDARLIKPLLKYYFAGDIPVFAISSIYNTSSNSYNDKDLNDVLFRDSEWLLNFEKDSNIKKSLQKVWGEDFQNQKRLYAFGVDLYRITTNMDKIKNTSKLKLEGATGSLYLGEQNKIERDLSWLKFVNGMPKKQRYLPT
ncbi:MAG: penicillin-binding protein activator [Pseudomonadota bacterium]|nr:penicillin-binding protein activator [Pseudomonadota bacterium]